MSIFHLSFVPAKVMISLGFFGDAGPELGYLLYGNISVLRAAGFRVKLEYCTSSTAASQFGEPLFFVHFCFRSLYRAFE